MEYIEQLFRQHYAAMYAVAMAVVKDEDTAKDAVSDVFTDMLCGRISVKQEQTAAEKTRTRSFLLLCVRNRCLNIIAHLKVKDRVGRLLTLETSPSIAPAEAHEDHLGAVIDYMENNLRPQTRHVMMLRFKDKKKYREIAEMMGISEVAVYKHLSQGIKEIKNHFKS